MIDWILAEKIAAYVAGKGDAAPPKANLVRLAAESERRVTAYTGLRPSRPLPPPEGIERREWIRTNIKAMRQLLDPVLDRAGGGLGPLRPAVQLGLGFVVTTEVAVVLGYLAQRVLGQYELVLLDEAADASPPRLLFVLPNLGQAVQAFGAEEDEFVTWVALHEVTHAVQFAGVPWLHDHVAGLVRELLEKAELRIDAERKLRLPSADEVRRVAGALRRGDLISIFTSSAERETLDHVQAVMAVIEGHAEHVMDEVAPDLIPSLPKLRSALDHRRKSQSGLSRVLAKLLGLELKLRQYEQGKYFCDAVVARAGAPALGHVFSGPAALPTLEELRDPPSWLRRVGLDGALPQRSTA
ncbi:MAG: zinc-dependent metalloprotease [Solirubrobacteraceae bacterium]